MTFQTLRRLLYQRRVQSDGSMPFVDHLRELRDRLIRCIIFVGLAAIIAWFFYDPILDFLKQPYCQLPARHRILAGDGKSCTLLFFGPLDGFLTRLKVSIITGIVFSAPFWLYQVWAFITPGLRGKERRWASSFVVASSLLFALGSFMAYVTLAKGLELLIGSAGEGTAAAIAIPNYLSFVTSMLLVFGISFEVPLLVVMLNLAGILSYQRLRKWQRLAIFLIFVFAAIATPSQDPFTMCALAIPMCLLFEGAVLFAWNHDRRKARREAAAPTIPDDQASPLDTTPSTLDDARS